MMPIDEQRNIENYIHPLKANELRIGNWIMDIVPYDAYLRVDYNNIAKASVGAYEYRGIILTTQILENCGFRDITEGYRATGQADACYRIELPNGKYLDLYDHYENGKTIWYFLPYYETRIIYVHQLQNLLFVIAGEELTIYL